MRTNSRVLFALLSLALVPAWALAEEVAVEKKVRVHKIVIDCEGEECDEQKQFAKRVLIDSSGNAKGLHGDHSVWIGDGDDHAVIHAGSQRTAFLGVGLTELTPELRDHFGVAAEGGVMVSRVVDGSPAFQAGLEVGDILAAVDGESTGSARALSMAIGGRDAGEQVTLEVWRDGQLQNITASLDAPSEQHFGSRRQIRKKIHVECDDDADDCNVHLGGPKGHKMLSFAGTGDFDCGSDECEVHIQCSAEDDCSCTVNGEDTDCSELGH